MKRLFLGLVLLALVVTPAVAQQGPGGLQFQQGSGFGPPVNSPRRWQRISGACRKEILKETGVSEEKIKKIQDLAAESCKKMIRLKAEIEVASLDLETAFQQKTIAKQSITKLANKLGDLKKEKAVLQATSAAEILSLLSDQERENLSKCVRERHGKKMRKPEPPRQRRKRK